MLFGTYMGGYWILKFVLLPTGLLIPFLSFLFIGFTVVVPFMGYRYARLYRDQACGGCIGFPAAWGFTLSMYTYASLLTAVGHYIYFRFIDRGFIYNTCLEQIASLRESHVAELKAYADAMSQTLEMAGGMPGALEITMQMMSFNVFWGLLLAVPTALLVMRKEPPVIQQS